MGIFDLCLFEGVQWFSESCSQRCTHLWNDMLADCAYLNSQLATAQNDGIGVELLTSRVHFWLQQRQR